MSPNGAEVLVADHEPEVGEMSRRYLARAGLSVRLVTSPAAALGALASGAADLFVIDLTMLGLEVPAVRRALLAREAGGAAGGRSLPGRSLPGPAPTGPVAAPPASPPVVFLLDRHGVRPRGLSDGLECRRTFLARPFSPRALVDAVTDLLRPPEGRPGLPAWQSRLGPLGPLAGPPATAGVPGGGLHLDGERRRVALEGNDIDLTRTEFALLAALASQPGRALSRQALLTALEAERGKRPTARAIDVYITQLRAKLGAEVIQTVHGVGYALYWPLGGCSP